MPDRNPTRRAARALRRGALAALAGLAFLATAPNAAGQDAALPERRVVAETGVDFYGGDLRSIFSTSLPLCLDACLAEDACRAITFNLSASACFLKQGAGARQAFPAAVSAELLPQPEGLAARAAARSAALGFLPAGDLAAARALALSVGLPPAADAAAVEAPAAPALAPLRAAVNASDAAADWLALSGFAAGFDAEDFQLRQRLLDQAAAAAVNAFLRAPDDAVAAEAARRLAMALEAQGEGRRALDALRLSAGLAPGPRIEAEVARAEGLYGFRVVDRQVEAEAAEPRICVEFSEPLDPRGIDYADYVQLADAAVAPPVEAEGSRLCLGGLVHGARYVVTLRAGLPSAAGETLRAPVRQELYIRDRSPAVRFLGRAYVLPKSADAAIPVSTVNLDRVELRLARVGARSLAAVIRSGDFGGALTAFEEGRLSGELGAPVWEGEGEVGGELNRDVVTALPFGEVVAGLEPGLYALTARAPDRPQEDWETLATQWFVLTDLGLATFAGADGLHVFVRSLASAEPRAGVTATLLARNNEILGTAVTDAAGRALFAPGLLRGRGGDEPALVTLEAGSDFAFLDLEDPAFDLSDRGVDGRPAPGPVDVFLATERGAYRAGETVFATILARDAAGAAVEGLPLTAIVARPDGVEHLRASLPDEGAGGRAFALRLDPGAQRGGWRLSIHADPKAPALASTGFLVEDFDPERLALALTAPEGLVDPAAGLAVAAQADFLFGAPGGGLPVEGEAEVRPGRELPGYPGFRFGLEDEPFRSGYAALPGGIETDANGRVALDLPVPDLWPTTRPLDLVATLRIREGSGQPVERSLTRPLRPAGALIGIRPLFEDAVDEGATAGFEAIAVGPDLARRAIGPVEWTLSRIDTDFQWYELNGTWNYETVTRRVRVANGTIEIGAETPARLDLPVDWGRHELRLAAGGAEPAAASLGFDAGWGGGAGAETPDFVALSLDRQDYVVGDVVRARIEARAPGRALVAVVGDRLIETREIEVTAAGAVTVDLPVTADWGAGAYVVATLIRPMDVAARRNPARAIGVAWAAVDPGARRLAASFDVPDEASPRGDLPVALKVEGLAAGTAAYATIAAVDVGILNLTGFESPDPEGWYFGQRRLGVAMRDVYGRLIDGMQGVPGRLRSGGDGGGGFRGPPPTQDLLASFSGVLVADASGVARTVAPLPDFNGTVRLMAVVWTAAGVGQAEKDVLVRDPVVAQVAMPRFMAPGDRSRLRLDLTHAFGPAGAVAVTVSSSDPALLPAGGARLAGTIAEAGRLTLTAPLTAGLPGDDRIAIETTTPGGARLTQGLTLPVRANDPEIARQSRVALAPGQTLTLDAAVLDGLEPGTATATLAAGPLAAFDVPGLLTALEAYPWGCTEQIVSRATPLLYFAETARALGLESGARADARIAEAIAGVLANQTAAGGFGLWAAEPGEPWIDAYATDFLSRARALGHAVPDRAFAAALANLSNIVNAYGDFETGGEDLAYALMVLAREGRAAIGDLRYYADARAGAFATPLAQAQLGLALAQYGDQPRADAMFRLAAAGALAGEPEQLWRADFGSGLRDAAGVLALSAEAGSRAVDAAALAAIVTAPRERRSPQEAVWSLLAAQGLLDQARGGGGIAMNGAPLQGPAARLLSADLLAGPVEVANIGTAETLVVVTAFGVPTQPEPAGGNGYRMSREYFTLDGAPADLAAVGLDDRLVAVLTVTPERDLEARLIVDDPLPAGFIIENPQLLRSGDPGRLAWLAADDVARHSEFRTDRFVAAVDWRGTEAFRLAYLVRAASPGSFHHPAASVEDMYRPAWRARTAAGRVEIAERP